MIIERWETTTSTNTGQALRLLFLRRIDFGDTVRSTVQAFYPDGQPFPHKLYNKTYADEKKWRMALLRYIDSER